MTTQVVIREGVFPTNDFERGLTTTELIAYRFTMAFIRNKVTVKDEHKQEIKELIEATAREVGL